MKYTTFKSLYYKAPDTIEHTYTSRYDSDLTRHFSINIRQYNHNKEFPAFLCHTENMLLLLERIYKQYEKLFYVIHTVPPVVHHQFSLMCIVDEVKSTNDIEGVHSTRKELKALLNGSVSRPARFESIVNKYKNLLSQEFISFHTCQDIRDFYDNFAHEEISMENISNRLDGKIFRKESVDILSPSGKTIHRGVYPESKIIAAMTTALHVLHDETIPMLVRLALFHYFFAYIHPFYDGNGRTDRFITSYFLGQHLHPFAALRLSVIMKKHRKKYYSLFEECDSELNRGDMTPFVHGFLALIADSLEDTTALLQRKNAQLKKYKMRLDEKLSGDTLTHSIYYILLQAALFYGQGVTIQQIMDITQKSRGTIQKRLDQIPEKHIVKIRYKQFYYKLNMLILKEPLMK